MRDVIESVSPHDPSDTVLSVDSVTADEVAAAAHRVRAAQKSWWALAVGERAGRLSAAADALAAESDDAVALVVREVGKPVTEARGEVARAVAILRYYAQASHLPTGETYPSSSPTLLFTQRRPHGVAGLITPWNFPLAIPLWKAAPALAAGNGVLLKPSPDAVACATWLGELMSRSLPPDLFTVVPGGAETGSAVVGTSDVVSFTGSVGVGRLVARLAAESALPAQCEMGGFNAAIVLPDADPVVTARHLANATMGYAGQKCTATRRIIVVGQRPELLDAVYEAVAGVAVGDPRDEGVAAGPVITGASARAVEAAVATALRDGGSIAAQAPLTATTGSYVAPTLVSGVSRDSELMRREVFGPLAYVDVVDSVDEAIALSNAAPFGLVTSVHGRDLDAALRVVADIETGMVKVNAPTTGVDFWAPFGGDKDSSYGQREQGLAALAFYGTTRTVTLGGAGG